jgi:predicted membrane channel-forming protein YqfA (hemolysin III family)
MDTNNKSPHILNTSATLFGLCFVVITSLKALKISGETLIDEFTAVAMLMFMASCLFSFLSIRSSSKKSQQFEKIADYGFLTGLLILFAATIFLLLNFIA